MKLLFDENLSPKLPRLLAILFPDSAHVRDCGLLGFPDEEVWEYARTETSIKFALINEILFVFSVPLDENQRELQRWQGSGTIRESNNLRRDIQYMSCG